MAPYLLSSALSQSPDEPVQGGNVCTGLKFQPFAVVSGQQAGILPSSVAPAQLLLTAVS